MNKNLEPRQYLNEDNLHIDGRNIPYSLVTATDYLLAINENWNDNDVENFIDENYARYDLLTQIMALKQACVLLRYTSHSCQSLSDGLYNLKWTLIKELKDKYNFDFSDEFVENFPLFI